MAAIPVIVDFVDTRTVRKKDIAKVNAYSNKQCTFSPTEADKLIEKRLLVSKSPESNDGIIDSDNDRWQ